MAISPENAIDQEIASNDDGDTIRLQFLLNYLSQVKSGQILDEDTYEDLNPDIAMAESIEIIRASNPERFGLLLAMLESPFAMNLDERQVGILTGFERFDPQTQVEALLKRFEAQYTFENVQVKLAN